MSERRLVIFDPATVLWRLTPLVVFVVLALLWTVSGVDAENFLMLIPFAVVGSIPSLITLRRATVLVSGGCIRQLGRREIVSTASLLGLRYRSLHNGREEVILAETPMGEVVLMSQTRVAPWASVDRRRKAAGRAIERLASVCDRTLVKPPAGQVPHERLALPQAFNRAASW